MKELILVNEYAAEHLIIACKNDERIAGKISQCRFCFPWQLFTGKRWRLCKRHQSYFAYQWFCKAYSGVSVDSFVKKLRTRNYRRKGCIKIVKQL
jgi:histidinol dehydrogenase